jgi:RNA polymerase sigma-70 factor (ECF subfamily)
MKSEQVFEILMRENSSMLLAFLRAAIRDEHAVEDLFQETLLIAWRRLDEFDQDKPFGAWLRGIAGKLALSYYRSVARHGNPLDEETLVWMDAKFGQLQNLRGDTLEEKLAALKDCVGALSPMYREPVEMRYSQSRPLAEITLALRLATDTLKKRLTRAKLQLADCLEKKLAAAN